MLESLGKSLSKIIDERLSNPLVVSFIFAWCGWNYKFLVLLFSKTPAMATFELIGKELYPDWKAYAFSGFLFPLGTTLVYIYLLPYVSDRVNDYWRKKQQADRVNRQKYEDQRLLTHEESRELISANVELEAKLEKLTDEANEATRTAKEAYRAKAAAEALVKSSEQQAQSATERYNVMKDSLDAVREERERGLNKIEALTETADGLREILDEVRFSVPSFSNSMSGMRGIGEPPDNLLMWYLRTKGVVDDPFNQTMLYVLTVADAAGQMPRDLIVEMAAKKMTIDLAQRALQTLADTGYVVQVGHEAVGTSPVLTVSERGRRVLETAGRYMSFFENPPGSPKPDAGTAG